MFSAITIGFLGLYSLVVAHRTQKSIEPISRKIHDRMQSLWNEAHSSIRKKQWLKAEKALLTILKFDKKDASAYNRLGIIYAKQQSYDDAIQCFEIAKSIKPAASNYHNLGLLYMETKKYDKALVAFEDALEMDPDSSMRYIALAKVYGKMDRIPKAISSLESAVRLEKSAVNYKLLAESCESVGDIVSSNKYLNIAKRLEIKDQKASETKKRLRLKKASVASKKQDSKGSIPKPSNRRSQKLRNTRRGPQRRSARRK